MSEYTEDLDKLLCELSEITGRPKDELILAGVKLLAIMHNILREQPEGKAE